MKIDEDNDLIHYGILRRSGRYPWGSSNNVNTRNKIFLDYVQDMMRQGLTESEVARGVGISVNELRAAKSIATNQQRQSKIAMAQRLKDKGYSTSAVASRMNIPESTARSYLAPGAKDNADILTNTANALQAQVDKKGYVDVGKGVESHIGVSKTRLDTALAVLKEKGYEVHTVKSLQLTTGHETNMRVLAVPGTTQRDVFLNRSKIQQFTDFSDDGGRHFAKLHDPLIINPKRVAVVYKEDGGDKADGVIYVRPGVEDVSIGGSNYAQVRVAVGSDHYLKGMAVYKNNLPDGVDLEFHTSKSRTSNKLDVMKKNADEPGYAETGEHPLLKSIQHQIVANPGTPNEHVTSAMNIVNEEGDWYDWSRTLSSQMLSKQTPNLAKTQLNMTYERRLQDFKDINSLTNDTVRKKLLNDFADGVDSAAVHLKAAALPKLQAHVILPLPGIARNQIFAPNHDDGVRVALIRHPHAGPFEIPELIVNNKNPEGRRIIGSGAKDAVGIHPSVAQWLSGADFDGDAVLVIPNDKNHIKTSHPLAELKDFDPRSSYPAYDGMKTMRNTQTEMGMISNLITDMSIQGAPNSDIARAVKHSMVVIDAEKHNLNYKLSYNDNGIKQLKAKYQSGGASTIISRAGADQFIPERKPRTMGKGGPVNTRTGALEFEPTNRINTKTGKPRQTRIQRLANVSDARELMSTRTGTPMERLYAEHSNKLKSLANRARLTAVKTPTPKQSASAKKAYRPQVESLNAKLNLALRNAPLERQAQIIANAQVKTKRDANPNMEPDTLRKVKYQALTQARIRTRASKQQIVIEPDEWDAIQAQAISNSKLTQILNNADMDVVRDLATPKTAILMTPTKTARATAMLAAGYTRAEVARQLGVSLSTLDVATKGG
jgi:DNA-binding CsgD family transcriptional regulator/transcriptional regulator with XRE-family HTH domain